MRGLIWRLVRAGAVAALVVAAAGWTVERVRLGASDRDAATRVESSLRARFEASTETLGTIAAAVAADRDAIRAAPRDQTAVRRLFEAVNAALPNDEPGRDGLTLYGPDRTPLAWAGNVSDLPAAQIVGPAALFVAAGALGPRLVRIEPILDRDRPRGPRLGTVVAERLLGEMHGGPSLAANASVITTSIVPVSLALRPGAAPPGVYSFVITSRGGGPLAEAWVSPDDLAEVRARLRGGTWAAVLSVLALTLLLCAAPVVERRRRTHDVGVFVAATVTLVVTLVTVRFVLWFAVAPLVAPRTFASPFDLLVTALLAAALVWIAFDVVERWRLRPRRAPLAASGPGLTIDPRLLLYAAAGAIDIVLLAIYARFLDRIVSGTALDVLHFSLHPVNGTRLAVAFGLVLLHASVIWAAATIVRLCGAIVRTPHRWHARAVPVVIWGLGVAGGVAFVHARFPDVPIGPLLVAVVAAGGCAAVVARLRGPARHASQAARLGAFFLALLVPALALYPTLLAYAIAAKQRLVATDYGPLALTQREDLQARLREALEQIDAMRTLDQAVAQSPRGTPTTDRASLIWSQTVLARYRLTSAIELYGRDGELISRFALNLPEYSTGRFEAPGCDWEIFDEVSPFGSSERHVLRASRGICARGRILGAIVVRAMLDYRALPFISAQTPYLESLRPGEEPPPEGVSGRDIEFAVYGWSRAPIYVSGTSVWPLSDAVFQRMVASRAPFWTTLTRDGERFGVYFLNDRGGIYALGYPVITWLGHIVNLAELVTLTAVLYLLLLAGATLFNLLTSRTPASGRALLREIRSSFYRKLFLAFVAAAVVPVVILAIATRTYFANQFRAGIEDAAARTASVAERLVEDYAALQQRGAGALDLIDDQIMVLVGRAIDEDVNLFDRAQLQATSERDLFGSRLLSTRTPGDVYRSIVLDRLPTFVGVEQAGAVTYLLAAAPVRAGDREGIVTVPVTLRQQEIERQIDELDRRVLFAAVLFVLLGAALGYWMAERIADPVNRLTRVTHRIARGDLDAYAATTSADELGRLIDDFNEMARELKRQRSELERTQRLEAWADMARQVAHDIKNPLTPIQLQAEHVRRVNADRGRPLSPVVDDCIDTILTQVRLLRQIAAEFSSFASSPTPRPEPTAIGDVLDEVVEPYRAGLAGRIAIAVDVAPDLPSPTIDRTLFGRALTNVIENALHAMPGAGRLTISAAHGTAGDAPAVVVRVTDTGVGMDPEALARIFEPYFSTKATGTGLGLTIAKRNVELNGGTIQVESQRGAGTTVTITVPV